MGSPYADLERPPLSERALRRALLHEGSVWSDLRVVGVTGSTNADVAALARAGAPQGTVVVAEQQTAGRGRLDRAWSSPPRAGLTLSLLLRPGPPRETWSWLPLLVGLAARDAVVELAEVEVGLKWPNDLLLGDRKLAGLLAEVHGDAVVVGIGLNVTTRAEELLPTATSLREAGAEATDRDPLLRALLRAVGSAYDSWTVRGGRDDALRARYEEACITLGTAVRVELTAGGELRGTATAVDDVGRLLVAPADGGEPVAVGSGDVHHVR